MGNTSEKEIETSNFTNPIVNQENKELFENIETLANGVVEDWNNHKLLLTVLVCGPSQSGKSTLINKMFNRVVADVATDSSSTTKKTQFYDDKEKALRLIDTCGFQRGERININEKPQLIWLVLNIQESINPIDFEILKQFQDVPALVILNKSTAVRNGNEEDTKNFDLVCETKLPKHYKESSKLMATRKQILSYKQNHKNIKRVLVVSLKKDEDNEGKPIGLTTLYESSMVCLNDCLRLVFVQNVSAFSKKKIWASIGIISGHVALVSGAAWVPVPAVDSILITGFETTMVLCLFKLWGVAGRDLTTFSTSFIKGTAPALLSFGIGYGIAQLLKFIPIYGTVAGGALSMSVATVATVIIGVVVTLYLRLNVVSQIAQLSADELEKKVKEFVVKPEVATFLKRVPSLLINGDLSDAVKNFVESVEARKGVVE